jgi:hypothetical protein
MKKLLPIVLVILALGTSSLACVINLGGPALPAETIPVSPDAADQLKEEFRTALQNARNGDGSVTLTISEAQLTSLLAAKLGGQSDPFITNPQVLLRDGQIHIYGQAHKGFFAATVGIGVSVGVDEQGRPQLSAVSADFGPLPVPEGLINTITDFLTEAYTSALGPVATGFRLEGMSVENGALTLSGRVE